MHSTEDLCRLSDLHFCRLPTSPLALELTYTVSDVPWPRQVFQPFLYFLHGSPSHHGSFFSPPMLSGVPAAGVLF